MSMSTFHGKYRDFLFPAEPHLVVGRRTHEKRFESILTEFKGGNYKSNLVIVSGSPGIGKTSLLRVFAEITESEMLPFVTIPIGMGKMTRRIFSDLYQALTPHLMEPKKKRLRKSKVEEIKHLEPRGRVTEIFQAFLSNITARPPKTPIVIGLDPIDRIIDSGQAYIIEGLTKFIVGLQGMPLLFVITCQEHNTGEIRDLIKFGAHFLLDRLDFSDAKLLLSKLAKGRLQGSSQLRNDMVRQSDRSPFNLAFIVDVISMVEDDIEQDGLENDESTIRERADPYVKHFALKRFINEIYEVSEEDWKTLKIMLGASRNAVSREIFDSARVDKQNLEPLIAKGLVTELGDYFQFTSYTLFSTLGSGLSAVDIKAEAGLLLQILETDMSLGFEINSKLLERLEKVSFSTEHLEDLSIPNRTFSLYTSAMELEKYFSAYRLALLTGSFFRMARDVEGAGRFFEECAQGFHDQDKEPYAIALYQKSLESYQAANNERKRKDIAQRTAMLYLQQGNRRTKDLDLELARTAYYQAIKRFKLADDYHSAMEAARKAIQTYERPDKDGTFFHSFVTGDQPKQIDTSTPG